MPTLDERKPHRARTMAESFGTDADRYHRARPRYPGELIDRIVGAADGERAPGTGREPWILDVGCGTGIEAAQLQARGAQVLGVEPDERMAQLARSNGLKVDVSTFEEWDPGDRRFDTVVAGQSWHWVDPRAGASKAANVLHAGGRIVLFGHVFAPPDDVAQATAHAMRRLAPDVPSGASTRTHAIDGYLTMYRRFAEHLEASGRFGAGEHWRFDWRQTYTRDQWLDLLPTTGSLTRLDPTVVRRILEATGRAIDARGGSFTMDYVTVAVAATRPD